MAQIFSPPEVVNGTNNANGVEHLKTGAVPSIDVAIESLRACEARSQIGDTSRIVNSVVLSKLNSDGNYKIAVDMGTNTDNVETLAIKNIARSILRLRFTSPQSRFIYIGNTPTVFTEEYKQAMEAERLEFLKNKPALVNNDEFNEAWAKISLTFMSNPGASILLHRDPNPITGDVDTKKSSQAFLVIDTLVPTETVQPSLTLPRLERDIPPLVEEILVISR